MSVQCPICARLCPILPDHGGYTVKCTCGSTVAVPPDLLTRRRAQAALPTSSFAPTPPAEPRPISSRGRDRAITAVLVVLFFGLLAAGAAALWLWPTPQQPQQVKADVTPDQKNQDQKTPEPAGNQTPPKEKAKQPPPQPVSWHFAYDEAGRTARVIDPGKRETTFRYEGPDKEQRSRV